MSQASPSVQSPHQNSFPIEAGAEPRISVAMATYNGAAFVAEQLASITAQTRRVDEIIICDDGSTDATAAAVEQFSQTSPITVHLHRNAQRLGVTRNFEQAITHCTGGLIFLADQDDVWHPEKVARLAAALADPAVGLAFSDAEIVGRDLTPTGDRLWPSIWFDAAEQQRVGDGNALPVLLRHAIAAGTTLAFKSSFRPLLLPIPDLPHSHDIWITLLIAAVARLAPIDEPLVRYRLHGGNQVGMRRYGLIGQLLMARHQVRTKTFAHLADLTQAAADRLGTVPSLGPRVLPLLEEKVRHSLLRDQLPRRPWRKWPAVAAEWRNGNYTRYSYGLKSVLQDLLLR